MPGGVAAVAGLPVLPGRPDTVVGVPLKKPTICRTPGLISKHNHSLASAARTLF